MSMKIAGQNYTIRFVGDGVSTSMDIDLYDLIHNDHTIHNKTPDGIVLIAGGGSPTGTLAGTVLTLTWGSAVGNGTMVEPIVVLTFPK